MSEPPHKKSRSDGAAEAAEAAGAAEPPEKDLPFVIESLKETGNKRYVATKDDGSSCSITINYSIDGWSAGIAVFKCNNREDEKRGGGDGKKLLLNVLKYIKEKYPRIILIDLVVAPTGKMETDDLDKLIGYYERLGFNSYDAVPSMMSAQLDEILKHNGIMVGGKRRTRKAKKRKSISKKVKKRRIKTKRKRNKKKNKYTKRN
jgi:hypothetical protein